MVIMHKKTVQIAHFFSLTQSWGLFQSPGCSVYLEREQNNYFLIYRKIQSCACLVYIHNSIRTDLTSFLVKKEREL